MGAIGCVIMGRSKNKAKSAANRQSGHVFGCLHTEGKCRKSAGTVMVVREDYSEEWRGRKRRAVRYEWVCVSRGKKNEQRRQIKRKRAIAKVCSPLIRSAEKTSTKRTQTNIKKNYNEAKRESSSIVKPINVL